MTLKLLEHLGTCLVTFTDENLQIMSGKHIFFYSKIVQMEKKSIQTFNSLTITNWGKITMSPLAPEAPTGP